MQWVVPELADAGVFHIVATGSWDANADRTDDNRITSLDSLMILRAVGGTI